MTSDKCMRAEAIVIGAGISGIAAAKCLQEAGFEVMVVEKTGEVGGLWAFKENGYGVMRFTHINVSKQNYCFSDFPFPDDVPDFPHNQDMAKYIADYTVHFGIDKLIRFETQVDHIERVGGEWHIQVSKLADNRKGSQVVTDKELIIAKFVAIATGHHAQPKWPRFQGQESFAGEMIHSVGYKDAATNCLLGKRVAVVGIGNSAVDVAVDCATVGRCKKVYLSTRSGAWVLPNYVFGRPTDHYACRTFLALPWQISTYILETVVRLVSGNPSRWGLKPKMHALQTQPTVSPTLVHHIQRGNIKVVPDIQKIAGNTLHFVNGEIAEVDHLILCTGYHIDLPFLSQEVRDQVFVQDSNSIKLYKNVFSPDIGQSLAFIGFVQPASGGILTMSETQARWFAQLCKRKVKLPTKIRMEENIASEEEACKGRYFSSSRHTIQRDPILYNDEIASFIGAKPQLWKHPTLIWRLLLSSCGAAQWRLQGPHHWKYAHQEVLKVPSTELLHYSALVLIALFGLILSGLLICIL